MRGIIYTVVILFMLVMLETVLIAMLSGHLYIQIKSPIIENAGFYLTLARDDIASTIRLILVEKPLFIIESQHTSSGSTLWSLHFFGITVFLHAIVAYLLAEIISKEGMETRLRDLPLTGAVLLILSSLYLLLASCCTGGPNWIVQTWLLALVFNPITSTNATIKFYQSIRDGFIVLQIILGLVGAFLIFRSREQKDSI